MQQGNNTSGGILEQELPLRIVESIERHMLKQIIIISFTWDPCHVACSHRLTVILSLKFTQPKHSMPGVAI